jgi:hypothetical protein
MSVQPSPSTSPRATPEPFSRMRLLAAEASARWLVKAMPEASDGTRVKPGRRLEATGWIGVQRAPGISCQAGGGGGAAAEEMQIAAARDAAAMERR